MNDPGGKDSFVTHCSLLMRLRVGGPQREVAWRDFYDRYAPMIGGFARKMGAKPPEIADVIHDVLLGFFRVSPQFVYDPSRGRFRGYLKTCTWRVLTIHLKERLAPDGRALISVDDNDILVEHAWNDIWETERLQRAIDVAREECQQNPARARTFRAFTMYVLLERSADDVARELSISVASVHQAKSRISRLIKQTMQEMDDTVG